MYDIVFVTHLPAFYKINLYSELAKDKKILVIFISSGSDIRNSDFTDAHKGFESVTLGTGAFERRDVFSSCLKLLSLLIKIKYKVIIVGGWDLFEFWLCVFLSKVSRNALALESSVFESRTGGIQGAVKKVFLKRCSRVYFSGDPHSELLNQLGFEGEMIKTGGVGLLTQINALKKVHNDESNPCHFLYVGRLSPEKNLPFIINFFKINPSLNLTIVGDGPCFEELKILCLTEENIEFTGYINNSELQEIYQKNDVFILPSMSEPWGLVLEEALINNLPIICSDKVGGGVDLVEKYNAGIIFKANDINDFENAINMIRKNFKFYLDRVNEIDFPSLREQQIKSYDLVKIIGKP